MMRSMFSGVSGLRIHQTKMDVIANNIANVNTVAFKSSRVTFSEVFYQKLSGASGANDTSGRAGVNAMQIGLGGSVASIDTKMSTGAMQRTDTWSDLMIDGDGFFIVGDNNSNYFTRAGAFVIDASGYLATPSGLKVMGWDAIPDPDNPGDFKIQKGLVKPIEIAGSKEYIAPEATTQIAFSGNLNQKTDPIQDNTIYFYDSIGNNYSVDVKLVYNEEFGVWDVKMGNIAYPNNDRKNGIGLAVGTATTTGGGTTYAVTKNPAEVSFMNNASKPAETSYTTIGSIQFDTEGNPIACTSPSTATDANYTGSPTFLDIQLTNPYGLSDLNPNYDKTTAVVPNATFGGTKIRSGGTDPKASTGIDNIITLDFSNIRQYGTQKGSATNEAKDGTDPGTLERINIGTDGKITGGYSNGKDKLLGQIATANFANPAGLEKIGDNLYTTTPNSGKFDGIGTEVQSNGGTMRSGVLEMSNVDLSGEFTEMITTQRGFQANSRVITTSDDLLQELVNLKR